MNNDSLRNGGVACVRKGCEWWHEDYTQNCWGMSRGRESAEACTRYTPDPAHPLTIAAREREGEQNANDAPGYPRKENIRCPECTRVQLALVRFDDSMPAPLYVHTCEVCGYMIMESDWEQVKEHDYPLLALVRTAYKRLFACDGVNITEPITLPFTRAEAERFRKLVRDGEGGEDAK